MAALPHLDDRERRNRVQQRHRLGRTGASATAVAGELGGLHATDPATVYLSARARVPGLTVTSLERELYDDRTLVRMLGMRRTVFVLPPEHAAVMEAACTQALVPGERRKLEQLITEQGHATDAGAWLAELADQVLAHLDQVGEASAAELGKAIPALTTKLDMAVGKSYGGTIGLSTRLLFLMAIEGHLVRGRPLGSWISSQYRWAHTDRWLGEPLHPWDPADARAELARRWLATYGPAPTEDLKWWTGWPLGQTRAAIAACSAVEVTLDGGGTGWVLPDDLEPVTPPEPVAALLPSLDPATMGWKSRDWYLGPHAPKLFDRNGNGGPTIWWDGHIVGGWVQLPDGRIATELLTTDGIGADARAAIDAQAADLEAWLGDTRVKSRFPTPLEKALVTAAG